MKKICITCKNTKDLFEFPKRVGSKDGTRNECKKCYSERSSSWAKKNNYKYQTDRYNKLDEEKKKNITKEQRENNKKHKIFKKYGLTILQYNKMVKNQGNKCKICSENFEKTPCIDHDHKTGRVRGLLCSKCNSLLGFAKDNIKILNNAIAYLGISTHV